MLTGGGERAETNGSTGGKRGKASGKEVARKGKSSDGEDGGTQETTKKLVVGSNVEKDGGTAQVDGRRRNPRRAAAAAAAGANIALGGDGESGEEKETDEDTQQEGLPRGRERKLGERPSGMEMVAVRGRRGVHNAGKVDVGGTNEEGRMPSAESMAHDDEMMQSIAATDGPSREGCSHDFEKCLAAPAERPKLLLPSIAGGVDTFEGIDVFVDAASLQPVDGENGFSGDRDEIRLLEGKEGSVPLMGIPLTRKKRRQV